MEYIFTFFKSPELNAFDSKLKGKFPFASLDGDFTTPNWTKELLV